MSKHCCFCIPVRFAVFFFSLITFLSTGFAAIVMWGFVWGASSPENLAKLEEKLDANVDRAAFEAFMTRNKVGFIIAGVVFTFIALTSFFGFIGSIIRNRRMVKAYSYLTVVIFFLFCAMVGYILFLVWNNKPLCVTVDGTQTCTEFKFSTGQKAGYTAYLVVDLLIQLYIVVTIRRYYEQLQEERDYYDPALRLKATGAGHYEAREGLLPSGAGAYPYADKPHSFGSHA